MSPRMMFSALAVSVAALGLSACSDSPPPPPLQNPSQTNVPVSVAPAAYPPTAPDEVLTASTAGRTTHGYQAQFHTAQVKGIEACLESAKFANFMKNSIESGNSDTYTSCMGSDGKARAAYACTSVKASGSTICRPF